MQEESAYGLWSLVIINSFVFVFFVFSFTKPKTKRDWRSLGVYSAFIVAMFTEMYGFPLTIYLLAGWLQRQFPETDLLSHDSGHLWHTLLGFEGNPHFDALHILSTVIVVAGFLLLASSWRVLHESAMRGGLATQGIYARVRHPQYLALLLIMFGFLLQWPTLITLIMFPVMVYIYVRLARSEEADMLQAFGAEYRAYVDRTPAFLPRWSA